jgi:rhamnose transport system ATP-binding protein
VPSGGVSFTLRPGEVHALLGENGAGKSTLIKTIAGAHAPDGGRMRIAGHLIADFSPARARSLGVSCLYQQPALFPDLTVTENLALRLEASNGCRWLRWPHRRQRAQALLDRVGATFAPETEVRSLSMPQQQLVEMACALGAGARIVIMDEPTASLTRPDQERLFGVVRDLRASGIGVIYITHRLEEIFQLADRVTVLRDGESLGTWDVRAMTEAQLIEKMVGREVAQIYPPSESQPGEVVLALRRLGCAASGVDAVDLEVRSGEVVGLAGLVGAGRTELARVLFGITPADQG